MESDGDDMPKNNSLQLIEGRLTLKTRSVFLAVILHWDILIWLKCLTYFLSDQLICSPSYSQLTRRGMHRALAGQGRSLAMPLACCRGSSQGCLGSSLFLTLLTENMRAASLGAR